MTIPLMRRFQVLEDHAPLCDVWATQQPAPFALAEFEGGPQHVTVKMHDGLGGLRVQVPQRLIALRQRFSQRGDIATRGNRGGQVRDFGRQLRAVNRPQFAFLVTV